MTSNETSHYTKSNSVYQFAWFTRRSCVSCTSVCLRTGIVSAIQKILNKYFLKTQQLCLHMTLLFYLWHRKWEFEQRNGLFYFITYLIIPGALILLSSSMIELSTGGTTGITLYTCRRKCSLCIRKLQLW